MSLQEHVSIRSAPCASVVTSTAVGADGVSTVAAAGEIDIVSAEELQHAAISALERSGCRELQLNLSGVSFIDSTGLSALIMVRNHTVNSGQRLVIVARASG